MTDNDINDLFSHVATTAGRAPRPDVVDADVERGQRALAQIRRRRTQRAIAGITSVAAAAALVAVVTSAHDSGAKTPTNVAKVTTPTPPSAIAVKLIAYTGRQLAGFTVDRVPEGWHLSGSTQYALTINPQDGTNDDPNVFLGKLTVLLQSQDASGFPKGDAVTVNGHPGVITHFDEQALTYNDDSGHTVVIQAPGKLAWSSAQLVSFAEGVHVTGNAVAGRG